MASLVSGFGGAGLGALIGGGASWLTMRHQASLDAHRRRMDRLDDAAAELSRAANRVWTEPDGRAVAQLQELVLLAMGRAHVPSPALAQNLSKLVLLLGRGRSADELREGALRISLEVSAWLGDPERYERRGGTITAAETGDA
ncbi:hypothetical protein ASG70_16175 [Phycicoccus sp. Soil748]|nr:hypothetical protein ASG70_16175 [Phycicoccus sp. Soil748]